MLITTAITPRTPMVPLKFSRDPIVYRKASLRITRNLQGSYRVPYGITDPHRVPYIERTSSSSITGIPQDTHKSLVYP